MNLLPFLTGQNPGVPHEVLYWRFGPQLALRMGDWKLLKAPAGGGWAGDNPREGKAITDGAQIYNLRHDLGEKDNLAEKNPEKFRELVAAWERIDRGMIDPCGGTARRSGGRPSRARTSP